MRALIYPITVALALTLVAAPSFPAIAQRGERDRILEERIPLRPPGEQNPLRTPREQIPLRTQTFGGHVYHGQLAWRDGR